MQFKVGSRLYILATQWWEHSAGLVWLNYVSFWISRDIPPDCMQMHSGQPERQPAA